MTPEERLTRLEDAIADLGDIIQQKFGYFIQDVNPVVVTLGARINSFVADVAAERT